jgi:uncharacterized tellurite resistance protein B-like protein
MNQKLFETLGKVIVATGWADKKLTSAEIENLKDLLFQFQSSVVPDPREDAMFQMYTGSPVEAAERERLVRELREAVWSEEDKTFIFSALKKMVEADGSITPEEQVVLDQVQAAIHSVDTGMFGALGRLMGSAMQRRSHALNNAPNREKYFDDFLKNKVYYEIRRRLDLGEGELEIAEQDLRKLSTIGGLMARVAQTDHVVLENEIDKITSGLQSSWGLSRETATFVMECAISDVCKDFDYLRMSREFIELATYEERVQVLDLLFSVAKADGQVSNAEFLEINHIADDLLLNRNRIKEAFEKPTG